jgi:hypothetical protein
MLERIVQPQFTFAEEIAASSNYQRKLRLGDLREYATIINRGLARAV